MCYAFGQGDSLVNVYWLLRQWRRRAQQELRPHTSAVLSLHIEMVEIRIAKRRIESSSQH